MFKAMVLVCLMVTPTSERCAVVEDEWGPYNTIENCNIRVNQMSQDLFVILSSMYTVTSIDGACVAEKGELA
jgi:hypothetical protein